MPRLHWPCAPIVVEAVLVGDRCGHEFIDVDALQANDADIEIRGARRPQINPFKRAHAAMSAKEMVRDFRFELIIRQILLALQQAKVPGPGLDASQPHFRADGAIALDGSGPDVHVKLKADRAAMAVSRVSS
jgi:hypothetical protein